MFKIIFRTYNFKEIELKWQKIWSEIDIKKQGKKFYCLSMFPYPSGNLHIGHVRVYSISDTISRFEFLNNKNVLHPMGWDAFGLPAENAAIERKIKPSVWTFQNIMQMKSQMHRLGFIFNWEKEIFTCSSDYYKWTQFIFLILFRKGLAYQSKGYINWDPVDQTVLANEQIDNNGKSWRSGAIVEKKLMKQWYFKITDYAESLLDGLKELQWPEAVIEMQKGWIGKTKGIEVVFKTTHGDLKAFTTKIETIMGVSFLALAPEHEYLTPTTTTLEEAELIKAIKQKSENQRKIGKSAIILQTVKAIHPITKTELPIFVCEYVLINVGTGCIMGVPGHDSRDQVIALQYNLKILKVLEKDRLINSQEYTGMSIPQAAAEFLQRLKAEEKFYYRIKDWLVSRQRYWGVPIPIIHCQDCGPVPEQNLPLVLPEIEDKHKWLETLCPSCGKKATRESDTLDTFVDSSWYYLRYIDSQNQDHICDKTLADTWTPVDIYIGGIEHAIMHLLYSRFIHKVLKDENILTCNEPFTKLLTQGLVLGPSYTCEGKYITAEESKSLENVEIKYEKMSKSKKNGISPEEIMNDWGADTLRLVVLFAAPSEKEIEWNGNLLKTMKKWLSSISDMIPDENSSEVEIDRVSRDITRSIHNRKLHVAIARLMEYKDKIGDRPRSKYLKNFLIMMYPFAPHLASEMFSNHFGGDVRLSEWPCKLIEADK